MKATIQPKAILMTNAPRAMVGTMAKGCGLSFEAFLIFTNYIHCLNNKTCIIYHK